MKHVETIPPHWSDDPAFSSEQQYLDFKAGITPHPRAEKTDPIYINEEDGVSVYVDRKDMTGIDHAMMRDRVARAVDERIGRGLYEAGEDDPGLIDRIYAARYGTSQGKAKT